MGAMTGDLRYYALTRAVYMAAAADSPEEAKALAKELLAPRKALIPDWNYGNAVHAGNSVLGRIALRSGDVAGAEDYLIRSVSSVLAGSPQLNSFGPNMSLALDLLQAGHSRAVLQYFELCRAFWKLGGARLDTWTADVQAGKMPNFGANLVY